MTFMTAHNDGRRVRTQEAPDPKGSRTKQSFQFEGDPNTLMKAFGKTGNPDLFKSTTALAQYGDFSEIPDFATALIQVQEVRDEFMRLPSEIRNHVNNSPAEFMELLADPSRHQEMVDLGLVTDENQVDPPPIPTAVPAPAEPPSEPEV